MQAPVHDVSERQERLNLGAIYSSLKDCKERQDILESTTISVKTDVRLRLSRLEGTVKALAEQPKLVIDFEALVKLKDKVDLQEELFDASKVLVSNLQREIDKLKKGGRDVAAHSTCDCQQRTKAMLDNELRRSLATHYEATGSAVEASNKKSAEKMEELSDGMEKLETRLTTLEAVPRHADTFQSINTQLRNMWDGLDDFKTRLDTGNKTFVEHDTIASIDTRFTKVGDELDDVRTQLKAANEAHEHRDVFASINSRIDACYDRLTQHEEHLLPDAVVAMVDAKRLESTNEELRLLYDRFGTAEASKVKRSELDCVKESLDECSRKLDIVTQGTAEAASTSRLEEAILKMNDRRVSDALLEASVNDLRQKWEDLEGRIVATKPTSAPRRVIDKINAVDERLVTIAGQVSALSAADGNRSDANAAFVATLGKRLAKLEKDGQAAKYEERLDRLEHDGSVKRLVTKTADLERDVLKLWSRVAMDGILAQDDTPISPRAEDGCESDTVEGDNDSIDIDPHITDQQLEAMPNLSHDESATLDIDGQLPSARGSVEAIDINTASRLVDDADEVSTPRGSQRKRKLNQASQSIRKSSREKRARKDDDQFLSWKDVQRHMPRRRRGYRIVTG